MTQLDLPLDQTRFVVVDVESTGGTSGEHRLIEVAMVVVEGGSITERYSSLVNPHESIPEFIVSMTGITNDMVVDAPSAHVALAPVVRALQSANAVFVAHNVGFDWGVVRKTLLQSGELLPDIPRICTCKLSRRLHGELKKHDLASVATWCGVEIRGRHRALGDAEATAEVLQHMLVHARLNFEAGLVSDLAALQYVPREASARVTKVYKTLEPQLRDVPTEPGVYYFYTSKRKLLYVGKAINLARRVRSYFHDSPLH